MLSKLVYPSDPKDLKLDDRKIACCPPPHEPKQPPSAQDPDCCYNTWKHELDNVNARLDEVNNHLTHLGKHLAVANDRLTRLTTWNGELVTANDLAIKVCQQLEIIEAQLIVVCRNTDSTKRGIEILICMIREFYVTVDELRVRYDRLVTCIKLLNNPALTLAQGIGKSISDFGAALDLVTATRDDLIKQVLVAYSSVVGLHQQICDEHGYKKLISIWQDTMGCRDPCEEGIWGYDPKRPGAKEAVMPDSYCLDPVLRLPICHEAYAHEISLLVVEEKRQVKELTELQTSLTKDKNHLVTLQTGLTNAIKEVQPSVRCS
jgi:hypothetical protein